MNYDHPEHPYYVLTQYGWVGGSQYHVHYYYFVAWLQDPYVEPVAWATALSWRLLRPYTYQNNYGAGPLVPIERPPVDFT